MWLVVSVADLCVGICSTRGLFLKQEYSANLLELFNDWYTNLTELFRSDLKRRIGIRRIQPPPPRLIGPNNRILWILQDRLSRNFCSSRKYGLRFKSWYHVQQILHGNFNSCMKKIHSYMDLKEEVYMDIPQDFWFFCVCYIWQSM